METLPNFLIKVLQILADRNGMSCTLEELTSLLTPVFNAFSSFKDSKSDEKENQAILVDALLFLNNERYIFLNSSCDKSCITIKGLILVNNKVFCN
ncbi:hypothetical protein [Flavobacterium sp. CSZ]|uniref:hypothetical protein n=1 Tax=Flavobacterium sp. CSZ TaxID=2783791 RepID=UPI00188B0599|nr:hypothetical protein [Flavobacterium sp. CSZ]MBF4483407.1 hypothetical protein [Flavobacterium sp. CSZ]